MQARHQAISILLEDLAVQWVSAYLAHQKADRLAVRLRTTLTRVQHKKAGKRLDFGTRITAMLDRVEQHRSFLRRLCDTLVLQIDYYTDLKSATRSKTRSAGKRSEQRA